MRAGLSDNPVKLTIEVEVAKVDWDSFQADFTNIAYEINNREGLIVSAKYEIPPSNEPTRGELEWN